MDPRSVPPARKADLDADDLAILARLATGVKDAAVCREMGLTARTFSRRVQAVMEALGARTRFQAGYLFGRHGFAGEADEATGRNVVGTSDGGSTSRGG